MGPVDGQSRTDVIGPEGRLLTTQFGGDRPLGNRPALLMLDCWRNVTEDRPQPLEEAIQDLPTTCRLNAWEALPRWRGCSRAARDAGVLALALTRSSCRQDRRAGL